MSNSEIAQHFRLLAALMDLHGEDKYTARGYANAAHKLEKIDKKISALSEEEITALPGFGKSIAQSIKILQREKQLPLMEKLLSKTPHELIELLNVKGLAGKKIALLWKGLGVESVADLLEACRENKLVALKGFGERSQERIQRDVEYYLAHKDKFLYASVEDAAFQLLRAMKEKLNTTKISLTGEIRRRSEVVQQIDICAAADENQLLELNNQILFNLKKEADFFSAATLKGIPVRIYNCSEQEFAKKLFETTGSKAHVEQFCHLNNTIPEAAAEEEIYEKAGLAYVVPELREGLKEIEWAKQKKLPRLISEEDIKGVLHSHTTYSDGVQTLREMAEFCKNLGYEYYGVCDHSQSAYYAGGMKEEQVYKQHQEVDLLNMELRPFKIFKGIESDIRQDGSLDYPETLLKEFDFIVASIHSNFKMSREQATERLIKAVENPFTTILGHMTGRLLLRRTGYPVDHKKVIDACAANGVVIELNANPKRLDMDWRWIPYALEKGAKISINPDAHSTREIFYTHYGICVARKAGLEPGMTLNTLSVKALREFFSNKKS